MTGVGRRAGGVTVTVDGGARVEAAQVLVATSAYSGWLRRLVGRCSCPSTTTSWSRSRCRRRSWRRSAGRGREGMSDAGYQFHYFRLTADDRILWGGYDAVYHPGNRVGPEHDRRPATFERLAAQTSGRRSRSSTASRFTHRWGGAIDTTTRFTSRSATPSAGASTTRWATPAWAWGRAAGRAGSCATAAATRLATAASCGSCGAAVPHPAGAAPDPGRGADAPRGRLGRPNEGEPRRSFLRAMDAARDRLRLRRGERDRQTGVASQFGSSRLRVASGSEPWPRTASWNARRSNADPSRAVSSARSRSISRWPIL